MHVALHTIAGKKSKMDFTASPNASAHRASMRLYGDSQRRADRKLERARQKEEQMKAAAQQFKASKFSETILKRAYFREFTPLVTPSSASLCTTPRSSAGEVVASNHDADMKVSKLVLEPTESAIASTLASPSCKGGVPEVCVFDSLEERNPSVRMCWSEMFDMIFHDTLSLP